MNRLSGWQFPKGSIAVAIDGFGNYVLLRTAGRSTGEVLFWDHETDSEEESDESETAESDEDRSGNNLEVLAPNFTAFLESLESIA